MLLIGHYLLVFRAGTVTTLDITSPLAAAVTGVVSPGHKFMMCKSITSVSEANPGSFLQNKRSPYIMFELFIERPMIQCLDKFEFVSF